MNWHVCMAWQIVTLLSEFGWASNILSFQFSMVWSIPKRSLNVKIFLLDSFPPECFPHNYFPYLCHNSLNPSSCIIHSNGRSSSIPMVTYCSQSFIYILFEFYFQLCFFYLYWPIHFFYLPLKKYFMDFSLGDKEATQLYSFDLSCAQWPITDRLGKKWHDLSSVRMYIRYSRCACGLKSYQEHL